MQKQAATIKPLLKPASISTEKMKILKKTFTTILIRLVVVCLAIFSTILLYFEIACANLDKKLDVFSKSYSKIVDIILPAWKKWK